MATRRYVRELSPMDKAETIRTAKAIVLNHEETLKHPANEIRHVLGVARCPVETMSFNLYEDGLAELARGYLKSVGEGE